jgi:FMN phosphatase YigB (HAD superfamily)
LKRIASPPKDRKRAVLFDFGGVVCTFSHDARLAALARASGLRPAEVHRRLFESGFDLASDRGDYSLEQQCKENLLPNPPDVHFHSNVCLHLRRLEPERNGAPLLADLPGWTLTPDEYQQPRSKPKMNAYTNHMRSQRLRNLRVAERRAG